MIRPFNRRKNLKLISKKRFNQQIKPIKMSFFTIFIKFKDEFLLFCLKKQLSDNRIAMERMQNLVNSLEDRLKQVETASLDDAKLIQQVNKHI